MSRSRDSLQPILFPAAERNKGPILEVLQRIFTGRQPPVSSVLEVGCGSGQHSAHFAAAFPRIQFTPSDVDDQYFGNIALLRSQSGLTNLQEPLLLDLTYPPEQWPVSPSSSSCPPPDVIYSSNVLHISPWECAEGLFKGAGHLLPPSSGLLLIYGPFAVDGVLSPESNRSFDRSLRGRDPRWGIRDVADLVRLATDNGLQLVSTHEMPANNKLLVFQKKQ